MAVLKNIVEDRLLDVGFFRDSRRHNIFITELHSEISPAFTTNMISRNRKIRFSGGIGLFFKEFEHEWQNVLSKDEFRYDKTLPLTLSIGNFTELDRMNFFRFTDDTREIELLSKKLFEFCNDLPKSVREFAKCLDNCSILSKDIVQFVHFFSSVDEKNLYFSKSASFFFWAKANLPEIGDKLFECVGRHISQMMYKFNRGF